MATNNQEPIDEPDKTPDYSKLEHLMTKQGIDLDEALGVLGKRNLDTFLQKYDITEPDLISILKSARAKESPAKRINLSGKRFRYGYFADPHIGQKAFQPMLWDKMIRVFKREKPEFILDIGDHLEGMSNRIGHVYELEDVGYNAQMNHAVELYSQLPAHTFGIDGNHDQWYFKPQNMGVVVGEELERRVPQYEHLGQNEGDLHPTNSVHIKLFHPNDGSAYAVSYKLQKLIESFSGGEKPNIVHEGHYHKALYMFLRNVHGFESGTLCGQTEWMRGKKLAANMGFGVVDCYSNAKGVDQIVHKWFPHYEE